MPVDGACQLRESTSETSARAAGLILVGNKATEAQPPVYVRTVMCFRLQTVVWKFLWRDWTFHWRIAGEQAHEAVLKKPSVRPNTAPPPNSQEISREERSDAPGATLTWGILWSSDYANWADFTNVIDPPSASGPVPPSLWLRLTVQSLAAGWRKLPEEWAGNRWEDTIWSSIYKYFSSTYWPQLRGKKTL